MQHKVPCRFSDFQIVKIPACLMRRGEKFTPDFHMTSMLLLHWQALLWKWSLSAYKCTRFNYGSRTIKSYFMGYFFPMGIVSLSFCYKGSYYLIVWKCSASLPHRKVIFFPATSKCQKVENYSWKNSWGVPRPLMSHTLMIVQIWSHRFVNEWGLSSTTHGTGFVLFVSPMPREFVCESAETLWLFNVWFSVSMCNK